MTEDEAKTKICPKLSKGSEEVRQATNYTARISTSPIWTKCIASDCMMWVQDSSYWVKDGIRATIDILNETRTPEEGGLVTVIEGHCGLTHG